MTDLERARALIHAWACDEHRELRLIGKSQELLPSLMERVADELAAGRREGAAAEQAWSKRVMAQVEEACADAYRRGAAEMRERIAMELAATSPYYARLVRALPLTPEEPT